MGPTTQEHPMSVRIASRFALAVTAASISILAAPGLASAAHAAPAVSSISAAPVDGPYGRDTCRQGYVWRETTPSDHVCVTPEQRDRARDDNNNAGTRYSGGGAYG